MALRQRLLRDIAELQTKPYPNITFVPYDNDITKACLILTPNGGSPLHFTIVFGERYPLQAPKITMQSYVAHPNIIGSYVCASILNTNEGYTPAFTLKEITIQLLSFFGSDKLEQDYGGIVDLQSYRTRNWYRDTHLYPYKCSICQFDGTMESVGQNVLRSIPTPQASEAQSPQPFITPNTRPAFFSHALQKDSRTKDLASMLDEVLCLICHALGTEELMVFANAWNRIGSSQGMATRFNLIRNRELLCFCLKKSFEHSKLGVGVKTTFEDRGSSRARQGTQSSEFDILSLQAFQDFHIHRSVQGLPFDHWLSLPLSRKHYASLSTDAQTFDKSALGRASERAIESYFHLFHLLLCQATEDPSVVRAINQTLQGVLSGRSCKQDVPNLAHLLISILISDADVTRDLLMAVVRETVTRNVVWMLDCKGSNMPELAYMEANTISWYRLEKTFEASKTSYRLLLFLNLFRQTINRGSGQSRKSLVQMRDELFDAHGAPPRGTAANLANDIRALQQVDSFPKFLVLMGLTPPAASQFTIFLRNSMEESVRKGYSVWGISQERALTLRRQKDPGVQVNENLEPEWQGGGTFEITFFPNRGGRRGGRGARGAACGRGRGGRGY